MPRKPAKPYHHGDLRESLVAAGTSLIEDDGVEAFTLRECARRAGVSHAAPKNHFDTAEDLLAEIAARGFERFVMTLDAAANGEAGQSPDRRLMAMGRAYVAFARAHPGVYGLMFRRPRHVVSSPRLNEAGGAAWLQLDQAVRAVIGSEAADSAVKSAQVWATVHGIASLLIDGRLHPSIDPVAVIEDSVASLPSAIRKTAMDEQQQTRVA